MGKADDGPPLILRVSPRGIVPASSLDVEILDGYRRGTELEARILRAPPSPNLRRWWAIMDLLAKVTGRWEDKRAASNAMLLEMECVDSYDLLRGGVRFQPMSLKDFSEAQLGTLCDKAIFVIERDLLPNHSMEQLRRDYERNRIRRAAS